MEHSLAPSTLTHHLNPSHTDHDLSTALSNRCMSHTPTTTAPPGNAPQAPATGTTAQQDKDKKPSLTGVRIKQRKRQAQAASKFEPEGKYYFLLNNGAQG